MAPFQAYYESPWQSPLLLWVVPVVFLVVLTRRMGFFWGYLIVFSIETLLDPLVTGPIVRWTGLSGPPVTAIMITFVILGDWRYFILTEHYGGGAVGSRGAWIRSVGWAFMVPVLQGAAVTLFPAAFENPRHTFLLYEVMFLAVAATMRFGVLPRREIPGDQRRWLYSISSYVMGYYALWASADVLILLGVDFGFGLRVVPNLLYYGLFLPFTYYRAPQWLR